MKNIFNKIKKRFLTIYYMECLINIQELIKNGEKNLELEERFFKYKLRKISK